MGSELSVSAEEQTAETEQEEPSERQEESKHSVLFLTEEEAREPSKVTLQESDDQPPGLILPNGDINWNCPCLGGMAVGPCGIEFREAFSCFHYSKSEVKGSECLEQFAKMQMCMKEYPELYEERKKEGEADDKPGEDGGVDKPSEDIKTAAEGDDKPSEDIKKDEESSKDSPAPSESVEKVEDESGNNDTKDDP